MAAMLFAGIASVQKAKLPALIATHHDMNDATICH
jgi:hypothetical protein